MSVCCRRLRSTPLSWLAVLLVFGLRLAAAQSYTSIVVFGDSLSDVGNDAAISRGLYTVNAQVPGPASGYTDGRFTDGTDTSPAARAYAGVWIEQLAARLPNKPAVKSSLAGGTDYAYGFATTDVGQTTFSYGPGNAFSFQVNNMGRQVADYLATGPVFSSSTLYVLWGGANDLLSATTSTQIVAAAQREAALAQTLLNAGATDVLIVGLPPLGLVPRFNGNAAAAASASGAAQAFDAALAGAIGGLRAQFSTRNIRFLDTYTLFGVIAGPPLAPGLSNVTAASQGNTAVNPDTYLFWDDLHPTTFGHSLVGNAALTVLGSTVSTTTSLASSAPTANLGSPVTFTATVTATAGSPVGTVTFLDGGTAIGTGLVAASSSATTTATFTTSSLGAGAHSITASFNGVNNYASSQATAISQTEIAPGYTAAFSPASLTVARGSTGTSTLTITPVGGLAGTFTLTRGTTTIPHLSFAFGSSTLTAAANTPVSTTVTVGTNAMVRNELPFGLSRELAGGIATCLLLPMLGLVRARRRVRPAALLAVLGLLLGTLGSLTGCGAASDPLANTVAAGTYQLPVNIAPPGGAAAQTVSLTLVVQ